MGVVLSVGFYAVFILFIADCILKMLTWAKESQQPALPGAVCTYPVFLKAVCDILLLRRLLRANDVLWLGEWIFHASLFVLFLRHLRYFLQPVPHFIEVLQIPGIVAAWLLPASLLFITVMKIAIEKKAYFSSYNFYLLGLLTVLGISGLIMKYVVPADLVNVKIFTMGLVTLRITALKDGLVFVFHFLFFLVLLWSLPAHIFAAPLSMLDARRRDEELPYLLHEK